jgi:hypothetical protein
LRSTWRRMEKLSSKYKSIVLGVIVIATMATNPPAAKPGGTTQIDYAWDMLCSGQVRPIAKKLKRRAKGRSLTGTDSIQPCTKHVYEFSAKAARHLTMRLEGSDDIWMFFARKNQNGHSPPARNWEGNLPADGEYFLTIVTTKPATYSIRLEFNK